MTIQEIFDIVLQVEEKYKDVLPHLRKDEQNERLASGSTRDSRLCNRQSVSASNSGSAFETGILND